ncbi:MAG: hypothetical protein WDW36_004612 [Sanguina aurantia]
MTQAFAEVDQGTDMYLKPVVVSPVELIPLAGAAPAVEESPVLLVTTVDIGGGRSERIEIRHGDDPSDAARHFCDRHRLPPSIVGPLTEHILDNIRKATTPAESPAPPIASDSPPVSSSHEQQQQQLLPSRNSPPLPQILPTAAPAITGDRNRAKLASDHKGPSQDGTFPGAGGPGGPFSFNGPLDERLLEQLSSKLVPMDGGSMGDGRLSNVLNAATELLRSGGSSKRNSVSSEQRQHTLKSRSAEPSPRDSVHLRLYVGAQDRQQRLEQRRKMQAAEVTASQGLNRSSMSWISTEMMRERTAGVFDNYGEMLYAEGLEASAVLKKKGENERAERDAAELAGATFHPEITALAKALYDGSGFEGSAAWQRLSKGMRGKTLERIAQLRTQQEVAEISECTFKPVLNRASVAMMAERSETLRSLNITHHEQLFQDAMRRQSKMDELANWYPDEVTFQPAVNKSHAAREYLRRSWDRMGTSGAAGLQQQQPLMQPSVTSSVAASEQGGNVDVVDRLYASYEKRNARLEEARAKLAGPVDPATGRTLYQPELGRGPRSFSRNHEGVPIGEYLHTAAQELASKRQAAADAESCAPPTRPRTAAGRAVGATAAHRGGWGNSHKLFQRLKLKRFQQVFEYLDEEACGSLDLVALVALPPFAPLTDTPAAPDARPPHAPPPPPPPPRSQRVENLDNEVLADVELAAALWAKEHGSLPPAPPDSLSAAGGSDDCKGSRPPPLGLDHFIGAAGGVVALKLLKCLPSASEHLNGVQAEVYKVGAEIARVEQQVRYSRETADRLQRAHADAEREHVELATHIATDHAQMDTLRTALAEGEPKLEALQQLQDDTADAQRDTETRLADWQQRWDGHTRHAGESSRAAEVERTKLNYLDRQEIDLSKRREALEAERKATDVAALDAAGEQLDADHDTQRELVETLGSLLDQHKLSHEKVLDDERQVQSALNEARQQLQSARGRHASLEALQHAALGQEESAASGWLARLGLSKSRRLGEALQVDTGWESAVETVLAGLLDGVLVDSPLELVSEFGSLGEANIALLSSAEGGQGAADTLAARVRGPAAALQLLANVQTAETLEEASRRVTSLGAHQSIITREGDWLAPHWARVFRAQGNQVGVLARERELRQLTEQIETLEAQLEESSERLDALRTGKFEVERARDDAQREPVIKRAWG